MPSAATFSLFPSAKEISQGHKSPDVLSLTSRRSTIDSKKALLQRRSVEETQDEPQSAGPSQPRTSTSGLRDSTNSKASSSTGTSNRQKSKMTMSPASERPLSPQAWPAPSVRSTSPTLVGSNRNSVSTMKPRKKAAPAGISVNGSAGPIRSMFPTYDPERQLQDQYYLPSQASPTNIPWEQVCKVPYSPDFFPPESSKDSSEMAGLLFTAPRNIGESSFYTPEIELPALWELSNGRANGIAKSQSYHLQMRRNLPLSKKQAQKSKKQKPTGNEPLLTFGPSESSPFLTVLAEKCREDREGSSDHTPQRVRIRKHNLSRFDPRYDHYADSSVLVSDLTLASNEPKENSSTTPELIPQNPDNDIFISTITPHKAILDSLSQAGTSSAAAELASVDPGASSVAAANLAERAMNAAKEAHTCDLIYTSMPGTRQRGYALKHPSLGLFRIQTIGDVRLQDESAQQTSTSSDTQAAKPKKPGMIKISAPITEKQLYDFTIGGNRSLARHKPASLLASIDLESSTLSLHGAELTAIDNKYILDAAVSALIGVMLAETASPRVSHLTSFAAPPTKAITELTLHSTAKYKYFPLIRTRKPKKMSRREKTTAEMEESLSVAFGAAVFVLGAAVEGLMTWADKSKDSNASNMTT